MIALLDIRFTFFCRSSAQNKEGQHPIVLRIIYRESRKDIFTGLYCDLPQWDSSSQRLSAKGKIVEEINRNLEAILQECKGEFDRMKFSGRPFTLEDLVLRLKGQDSMPTTIVEYLQEKVKELKTRVGIDITKATLQKYCRCIAHMQEFLVKKIKKRDVLITSITSQTITDFFYFLRAEQQNSHNTSVNYIKCLKTVLLPAIKNHVMTHDPFIGVKISAKTVQRGFLSFEEIKKIEALTDLPIGVEQARDIFLFACYTGMAYIDVKEFRKRNLIKDYDGTYSIHKMRHKTGILSIIPLLPPAEKILRAYSPTSELSDFCWTVISNQKINDHLKTIRELAKIDQSLFFHLARHTFATTITLSKGVPLETVSQMLGHTNIKMTQRYAKITGYKVKEDMKRVFEMF